MMNDEQILELYDREVHQECEWTRMRREVVPNIVRHVLTGTGSSGGLVSWSDISAANADAEIEKQIGYFRTVNSGFEWKIYTHDEPADLPQCLLAQGFKTEGELEAIMVAEMHALLEDYRTMDVSAV